MKGDFKGLELGVAFFMFFHVEAVTPKKGQRHIYCFKLFGFMFKQLSGTSRSVRKQQLRNTRCASIRQMIGHRHKGRHRCFHLVCLIRSPLRTMWACTDCA